jgi:hypothetical protein
MKVSKSLRASSPPVLIKHRWNTLRVTDVYEMAKAATMLWSSGVSG